MKEIELYKIREEARAREEKRIVQVIFFLGNMRFSSIYICMEIHKCEIFHYIYI